VRLAAIQHDIVWESPAENHARLAPMIDDAAGAGADLVILTEMFATGFSMATDRISEPEDGPSTRFLREQAARHGVHVCGSIAVRSERADKPFNQLVLAAPSGEVHRYSKIHPFTFSGEHERFAAGDAFLTVDVAGVRTSFFVCYDLRFADEFWALAAVTDLYVVVANWPEARRDHWSTLLRARAIENQSYVAGVNRVGTGGRLAYSGDSVVVDPFGEVVAAAPADAEATVFAAVTRGRVDEVRATYPFLPDRR
jgi:predicted amidohydrolase